MPKKSRRLCPFRYCVCTRPHDRYCDKRRRLERMRKGRAITHTETIASNLTNIKLTRIEGYTLAQVEDTLRKPCRYEGIKLSPADYEQSFTWIANNRE